MNKRLIYILIALVITVYINFTIKVNPAFDLIQTSLEDFKQSMLFEKVPIILNESIVNPNQLSYTIFKYMYIHKRFKKVSQKHRCNSKFTVVYNSANDHSVKIQHPFYNETIEVMLKQYQCIILPVKWLIHVKSDGIECIELDDILSIFCKLFI